MSNAVHQGFAVLTKIYMTRKIIVQIKSHLIFKQVRNRSNKNVKSGGNSYSNVITINLFERVCFFVGTSLKVNTGTLPCWVINGVRFLAQYTKWKEKNIISVRPLQIRLSTKLFTSKKNDVLNLGCSSLHMRKTRP